jgi:hypothetical protein
MLKKVVYVSLYVSEQDRALDSYTNKIGPGEAGRHSDTRRTAIPDRRR